jgi:hypothetical protein
MMRETTRLQLQAFPGLLTTGESGAAAELIQRYYFAPALIEGFIEEGVPLPSLPQTLGKQDTAALTSQFYQHEKFTGIIPKIERISDSAFYSALEALKNTGSTTRDPAELSTIDQYAERVAIFNLLRNRYMARQASVSGRFMPRLVAGFPALIVNRPKTTDTDDPIHFIGLVSSLSHSLTQDGGNTSVSLSYARPHTIVSEDDNFLKLLKALSEETTNPETDVSIQIADSAKRGELDLLSKKLATAAEKAAQSGKDPLEIYQELTKGNYRQAALLYDSLGMPDKLFADVDAIKSFACKIVMLKGDHVLTNSQPYWGPLSIADFWSAFNAADLTTKLEILIAYNLDIFEFKDPGSASAGTTSGDPQTLSRDDFYAYEAQRQGIEIADTAYIAGDMPTIPAVVSWQLSADKSLFKRSFEQIVTPPWFSDSYSNSKISSFYNSLLGCSSLASQVGTGQADTTRVTSSGGKNEFSVEAATKRMVQLYSAQNNVQTNDGDPRFIYNNTKRSIPTQVDVLHFHRFAFSTASAPPLHGLDQSGGGVVEANKGYIAKTKENNGTALDLSSSGYLDPRQERRKAVDFYVAQLSRRAFRG